MNNFTDLAIHNSKQHLVDFCVTIDKNYTVNWHHQEIANALEKVEKGEITRLIIEMPPRHGKSQLASIYFPAWFLGRNAEKEIITASYSGDLAVTFGGKTRDIVNSNEYQQVFNTRLKEDSKAKGYWQTQNKGGYTSVGRGGSTTGKGANIFLIDDPLKDREEAESETIRNKTWDWYTSVVTTRLEKHGAIIIIMTRWHMDDLVARVLESSKNTGEKWEIISFPAVAVVDEKYRRIGEPLWKDKKDLDELNIIKHQNIYDWYSLYQQMPIASEIQEFKPEYFTYFEETDLPKTFDIDITIDPAISKKKDACNTAIVAVGKSIELPDWFILDYKVGKFDPLELIDLTFFIFNELRKTYPFANIKLWIEGIAYQESLKYFFEEEMRRRNQYINLEMFKDTQDKFQRIRGLIPLLKTGIIKTRRHMKELEDELLLFPVGKTIDIADALAFHIKIKENTIKQKQKVKKAYKPMTRYGG